MAEAMESARARCSSTRASRARRAVRLREEAEEAIWGTAKNPTPTGRTQRRGKDATQWRMARSLTRREDRPRDAVGVP
jgi:hypothetical protein